MAPAGNLCGTRAFGPGFRIRRCMRQLFSSVCWCEGPAARGHSALGPARASFPVPWGCQALCEARTAEACGSGRSEAAVPARSGTRRRGIGATVDAAAPSSCPGWKAVPHPHQGSTRRSSQRPREQRPDTQSLRRPGRRQSPKVHIFERRAARGFEFLYQIII